MYKFFTIPMIFFTTQVMADHPTVAFGSEGSGPIATIAATPMPSGTWGVGIRTELIENDAFSDQQLADYAEQGLEGVHSIDRIISTSLSIAYGINDNLTLSARLPYIERKNIRESEIEDGEPEAHTHGDSSGFGDLLLFGQYRFLEKEDTDLGLLLGLKMPTGETEDKDDDGHRFETEFQPGTGSWDFLVGSSISYTHEQFGYHANVLFNKTTEGSQSTEIGDALSYNIALTYRINGEDHSNHDHVHHVDSSATNVMWDVVLELNGETRRKNKISGQSEENSGGTVVLVAPGLRVSAGDLGGFISVGLPIIENLNGKQTEIDTRIIAGLSIAL